MKQLSDIQKFYFGKNVFVTGATGFVGKLLIEKLLRCCHVQNIFILIRENKGKDIATRFDNLIDDPVFQRLKIEVPNFRERITLIAGDCSKIDCGLSADDKHTISEQVHIIFHLAATIRFNETLRKAFDLNVRATADLLRLAKNMRNLKVFMHMSTAYSHAYLPLIEEKFYPIATNKLQLEDMLYNKTDAELQRDLPKILGPWPNTYNFTKAVAENEILTHAGDLCRGVFRPAVVISTAHEPIKAWVDNISGATGVVVGNGKGCIHSLHCDENIAIELVPADYVVNCFIAAAPDVYKMYKQRNFSTVPPVYNYVSSVENRITYSEFKNYFMDDLIRYPLPGMLWYMSLTLHKYAAIDCVHSFLTQLIPAVLVDLLRMLLQKRPMMLKTYKTMRKLASVLTYFMTRNVTFTNNRTQKLWESSTDLDKQLFPFSMANLDWSEYYKGYALGIRRYALKENDEQLLQDRRKIQRLYYLHKAVKLFFTYVLGILFIYTIFKYT